MSVSKRLAGEYGPLASRRKSPSTTSINNIHKQYVRLLRNSLSSDTVQGETTWRIGRRNHQARLTGAVVGSRRCPTAEIYFSSGPPGKSRRNVTGAVCSAAAAHLPTSLRCPITARHPAGRNDDAHHEHPHRHVNQRGRRASPRRGRQRQPSGSKCQGCTRNPPPPPPRPPENWGERSVADL